jgi:hypothetical protein
MSYRKVRHWKQSLHFLSRNPLVTPQQAAEQKMMRVESHAAQDPQVLQILYIHAFQPYTTNILGCRQQDD